MFSFIWLYSVILILNLWYCILANSCIYLCCCNIEDSKPSYTTGSNYFLCNGDLNHSWNITTLFSSNISYISLQTHTFRKSSFPVMNVFVMGLQKKLLTFVYVMHRLQTQLGLCICSLKLYRYVATQFRTVRNIKS